MANRCIRSATPSSENVARWSAPRNVPLHVSPWLQCASRIQKHASRHCASVVACVNLPTGWMTAISAAGFSTALSPDRLKHRFNSHRPSNSKKICQLRLTSPFEAASVALSETGAPALRRMWTHSGSAVNGCRF